MNRAKPWRELSRDKLLDCRIFEVERSIAESPGDGSTHEFFRVRNGAWVQIIPVTSANEVVMVRQYRHGSQSLVLEVPGGLVDPGESPEVAAKRECLEETGYLADVLVPMAAVNPNPAIHTSLLYSFYARDVVLSGPVHNTVTEQTEVVLVPMAEIAGLLRSDAIDHALVVATLWRFLHDHT